MSRVAAGESKVGQGRAPDEKRQIKVGLLIWALIWIANKSVVQWAALSLPSDSLATVDLSLKSLNIIVSLGLILYTTRKWEWSLDDWGFTYDVRFWVVLAVTSVFVGYFWYAEGLAAELGFRTLRQALTGVWEELISTVFFTFLLIKYFRTLQRLSPLSGKVLAVVLSAIVFTLLHYGSWSIGEASFNTLSFVAYRAVYAFAGTFLPGLVLHGVSNSQFMAFPFLLAFYGILAFLNWRGAGKRGL